MKNNLVGKHTINYSIEYEIIESRTNVIIKFNHKQLKTFKRYSKKFNKLLSKMQNIGFQIVEQEE